MIGKSTAWRFAVSFTPGHGGRKVIGADYNPSDPTRKGYLIPAFVAKGVGDVQVFLGRRYTVHQDCGSPKSTSPTPVEAARKLASLRVEHYVIKAGAENAFRINIHYVR